MPELPEVENVRRSLLPLVGRRIVDVRIDRSDVIEPTTRARSPRARAAVATPDRLLAGGVVSRLVRHGKHMAIEATDGRAVDVQLGMSGQVLIAPPGQQIGPLTHLHVVWSLDDGGSFGFRDPRRFGGLWPAATFEDLQKVRWAGLGPDALEIRAEVLRERLSHTRRPIKVALMDQGVIAGLGNIYVAEALFDAGISPLRPAERLRPAEVLRLAEGIRRVLEAAVAAGGSTLRDYVNARGEQGEFQGCHLVYGRGGQSCVRCGHTLRSRPIGQRASVWCNKCQR